LHVYVLINPGHFSGTDAGFGVFILAVLSVIGMGRGRRCWEEGGVWRKRGGMEDVVNLKRTCSCNYLNS